MNPKLVLIVMALAGAVIALGRTAHTAGGSGDADDADGLVTDLIVGRIGGDNGGDLKDYGTTDGISAYAMGTTSCNNGDTELSWRDNGDFPDQHPVIAQNVYRLKDGRFEQIGMSWVKHGFCAADSTVCGPCKPATGCDWLGPGCSDVYVATLNGNQFGLGPRSEVNPATGAFAWPHGFPAGDDLTRGRIQIDIDDLDPALNAGALYFGESEYITPDDAGTVTANNNNSYRPILVGEYFDAFGGYWALSFENVPTVQQTPAIEAWAAVDPTVSITYVDVPGDGRFVVASKCSNNGDGTWHYEYAVFNMNSHRAGQAFEVAVPPGVAVWDIGFRDVDSHSGEPYSNVDWHEGLIPGDAVSWSTETFAENADANALRWGTLYNFRFDAATRPVASSATLHLFRPDLANDMPLGVCGPGASGDVDGDGDADFQDLLELLSSWGPCAGACPADLTDDGQVGFMDLLLVLSNWS